MGTPSGTLGSRFLGFFKVFQKLSQCSETLDMSSKGLGEMVEGDFSDICDEQFCLMLMGAEQRL